MAHKSKTNPFKNSLAEHVFQHKYAAVEGESWWERSAAIVEDVCGSRWGTTHPLMSKEDRDKLTEYIHEMKFIPGGRYIYYAGRPAKFFNNCLKGSETFLTYDGIKSFEEANEVEWVLTPEGKFERATISSFGEQEVYELTFSNIRGRSDKQWIKYATRDHRWILSDGSETTGIQVGDVVPAGGYNRRFNREAFIHGAVFADGNRHRKKNGFAHQLRLCGRKNKYIHHFEEDYTITRPDFADGDSVVYITSEYDLKKLPTTYDPDYIASFIEGWVSFDGHFGHVMQLHSIDEDAIDYFIEFAPYANFVVTGEKIVDDSPSNFGERAPLFRVNFKTADSFAGFKLVNKRFIGKERVYCATVPDTGAFILSGGVVTGNCYLLRAEHDTREEWSDVAYRAMSCLMTGGGIGIDYSRIRPGGRILHRTGGIASGPIPLMYSINEIGRNVMQGGSRRSAIYASLNWQHEDASDFLRVKNWDSMTVGDTSVGDLKKEDFNFPAPLDMTNISLNYDDDWLEKEDRAHDPTFLANCEQALKTGEPGFSFNFGDKENETLRNACTEVTSEDDSDVCNLGSINFGAIDDIDTLRDVVSLASKFLVCGTLRAELPYDKVYQVRSLNRRLGLGVMGLHEWLLKRGYQYEVTPELHEWLAVYRDQSEKSANEHCDRFFLNRPVAYRAIAPTGTIGILAGTTTGIEPLFAVAYKRRYLKDGTRWQYEVMVDSVAEQLVQEHGLDPDSIDTAQTLSAAPEQRMKFQADVQDYVDMGISSTINLPNWDMMENQEEYFERFATNLAHYAPRLRGFTVYPDGARGGQPLTSVPYHEAKGYEGVVFEENIECHNGICGV